MFSDAILQMMNLKLRALTLLISTVVPPGKYFTLVWDLEASVQIVGSKTLIQRRWLQKCSKLRGYVGPLWAEHRLLQLVPSGRPPLRKGIQQR